MKKTIFKYTLKKFGVAALYMPEGAQVLSVQVQHDEPQLWALVDPSHELDAISREFRIYGTGHPIDDNLNLVYVDTFQLHDGRLVFHVFEKVD